MNYTPGFLVRFDASWRTKGAATGSFSAKTMKIYQLLQLRTRTGAPTNQQAIAAATTWGIGGTALLWYGTDPVTTALGVSNIALYAGLYTAVKNITTVNTWVGAVVGAIPPIMGYSVARASCHTRNGGVAAETATASTAAAAASAATAASLLCDFIVPSLVGTLLLWQLPHFMALSYMYRADYTHGGLPRCRVTPLPERHRPM
jgi:heme o synthase